MIFFGVAADVGPKRAAEIATPLAVGLVSVVLLIGGMSYHPWSFGRRGVEVAHFDFVNTPQVRQRPGAFCSKSAHAASMAPIDIQPGNRSVSADLGSVLWPTLRLHAAQKPKGLLGRFGRPKGYGAVELDMFEL